MARFFRRAISSDRLCKCISPRSHFSFCLQFYLSHIWMPKYHLLNNTLSPQKLSFYLLNTQYHPKFDMIDIYFIHLTQIAYWALTIHQGGCQVISEEQKLQMLTNEVPVTGAAHHFCRVWGARGSTTETQIVPSLIMTKVNLNLKFSLKLHMEIWPWGESIHAAPLFH